MLPPSHNNIVIMPGDDSVATAKLVMTFIVTSLVLLCSLFVILAKKYTDADRKWAYGAIGTILGYWLGK